MVRRVEVISIPPDLDPLEQSRFVAKRLKYDGFLKSEYMFRGVDGKDLRALVPRSLADIVRSPPPSEMFLSFWPDLIKNPIDDMENPLFYASVAEMPAIAIYSIDSFTQIDDELQFTDPVKQLSSLKAIYYVKLKQSDEFSEENTKN